VTIQADVKAEPYSDFPVRVSPDILEFSPRMVIAKSQMEVVIKNTTSEDLDLRIVDLPSGFIQGELSDSTLRPSQEVKLRLELRDGSKKEIFAKSITLELGDQDSSRFTVPVRSQRLLDEH
jgi:hypothetical protein